MKAKQTLESLIPRPIRRFVKGGLDSFKDKYTWEFEWQRDEWLDLWKTQEIQDKCLEYWRRFRHFDGIKSIVHFDGDSSILDVGCGLSSVLHFLPGRRVGVDP